MISLILADIASRAVDDETAILASKADSGEFTVSHKKMIEAYLKDLFSDNPPRKGESERRTINYPGKRKKPEDEFESAIMNIGEEPAEEEEMDEGTRAMGVAGRVWADKARHLGQLDRSSKKSYREKGQPSKADQRDDLDALTKEFMARGGKVSRSMQEESPDLEEQGCNHTMEGEHCPVHGMNECGSMYEEIAELRRLSGLGECWDGMMMGDHHDTAGVQRHSAEMDRAKRLEQAIADKANSDAEAQTNWVIDQIRAQPTWTAPNLEEPNHEAEEVGSKMSSDHPHADQMQPKASKDQEVDEVILGPNDQPDMTDVAVARFGQGLRKELSKESDDSHEHKPDQDGDGVPDWADKKPNRDDRENKPEMEETREFYEAMRAMRRLSGLSEQTYSSTSRSDPNNPIDQAVSTMRSMSAGQRNAMTARNAAAEKAFYDANPHLVGDTATMQKLRDQDKLNFNPGTLSKSFDDQGVDPVYAQNRAAVDAAKQQRYREIDAAKSQDAIDKIQSKPAWTPGDQPWPINPAPAVTPKPAPSQPDKSLDDMRNDLQKNYDQYNTNQSTLDRTKTSAGMFGAPNLKESDSVSLLRKLAGI
jgi:hypothetical protein